MSNKAINNLTYTGIVTLSQYNGKNKTILKKIKNHGGSPLFNFLSDCLIGDFSIAAVNRPTKIMLLNKSVTDNTTEYSSASSFIYLLTKPEKIFNSNDVGSTVCYSFIIPRDYLEANNFTHIGLYPDYAKTSDIYNYSAICEVDFEGTEAITTSSAVLVVDWELIITNETDENNITKSVSVGTIV